ncbi:hypothetical protein DL93DRAFT_1863742 [Clavulina sp. PMI_390]|nr:hypothetical protein DL93DRAFT_1863742 [Clavulina sp. PMI_390]
MTDSPSKDGKEAYTSLILSYLDDSLFTESSATNVEIENTSDSDPLKPIASDMVRLISDLRATLPSSQQEGERTRGASRTAVSAQTSLGASTPSKRSVLSKAFNRTPAPSPSSHAVRDENRIRAWHSLLDFCITTITGAVGIDILGENVPDGDRYSLALMSFLQRGQWYVMDLFD